MLGLARLSYARAVSGYTFTPPRKELPEPFLSRLKERVANRGDIAAVWWLTVVHHGPGGDWAVDELQIELVDPPDEAATPDAYLELSAIASNGPQFSITPKHLVAAVRDAGVRVV
jgi:hypothetical protein